MAIPGQQEKTNGEAKTKAEQDFLAQNEEGFASRNKGKGSEQRGESTRVAESGTPSTRPKVYYGRVFRTDFSPLIKGGR